MNTAVNVNPVSGVAAGAKVAHVFRAHSLKLKRNSAEDERTNHAIVIRDFVHTPSKNLGVRELSAKLATYRKRYEEATKPKVKERNLAKCKELEKEMATRGKKRKGREAELVEASWAITKFPPNIALAHDPEVHFKIAKIAEKLVQKYFGIPPEKVGIAAHLDQASIHLHTVFSVPEGTTFTELLKGARYAEIQREFNELIREEFKDLEIQKIIGHKKYETLSDYKKSSVTRLEQELEKAKKDVLFWKEQTSTWKKIYEKEKEKPPVVVEKEVRVEVEVQDTKKIEELEKALELKEGELVSAKKRIQELETALKTTNEALDTVQAKLAKKDANLYEFCNSIGRVYPEFKMLDDEKPFAFLTRLIQTLFARAKDLTKQLESALSFSATKKPTPTAQPMRYPKVTPGPEPKPEPEPELEPEPAPEQEEKADLEEWVKQNTATTSTDLKI